MDDYYSHLSDSELLEIYYEASRENMPCLDELLEEMRLRREARA